MWQRRSTIAGLTLLALGLAGLAFVGYFQLRARALDGYTILSGSGSCLHPAISLSSALRVMSDRESQAVSFMVRNTSTQECKTDIQFSAPGFEISPEETTTVVMIPAGRSTLFTWVIAPRELGTYQLLFRAEEGEMTVGITVTDALGLDAAKVELLGYISTVVGIGGAAVSVISLVMWAVRRLHSRPVRVKGAPVRVKGTEMAPRKRAD